MANLVPVLTYPQWIFSYFPYYVLFISSLMIFTNAVSTKEVLINYRTLFVYYTMLAVWFSLYLMGWRY